MLGLIENCAYAISESDNSMTFSLIIPVHNVASYLRECLDSVLAQTYADWEAICVDDGSSDDSGAILDSYKVRDARIKVVHKRNAGVSAARNDALAMAKGEYVCFLDGDDVLSTKWLSCAKDILEKENADILRLNFTRFNNVPPAIEDNVSRYDRFQDVFEWGWAHIVNSGFIWLHFIKRIILEKNHILFPVSMAIKEDVVFCLRVLGCCQVACQGEYAGYYYRNRATSAGHSKRQIEDCLMFQDEVVKELENAREACPKLLCDENVSRAVTIALWEDFTQWLISGDKGASELRRRLFANIRRSLQKGYVAYRHLPRKKWWLIPCCVFKTTGFAGFIGLIGWVFRSRANMIRLNSVRTV